MHRAVAALAVVAVVAGLLVQGGDAEAASTPSGFQEYVALSGLNQPTAVRFASDGRVFVAEKSGLIKVFDSLADTTPTVFADLRTNVHNFWDRGLLGLALDPNFPADPYVYVLYTHDAADRRHRAPRWGDATCPEPAGRDRRRLRGERRACRACRPPAT